MIKLIVRNFYDTIAQGLEAINPDHLKWEVIDQTQPEADM
jgi:hypothetical protein